MPEFVRQYRQVAMTYLRRPAFFRLLVPSFSAWAVWLVWKMYSSHGKHWWMRAPYHSYGDFFASIDPLFFFLPFAAVLTYVVILMAHVREQLATPRTYLIASYRVRHLVVAMVAFLAAPLVGVTVTLTAEWCLGLMGGSNPLALLAIALTLLVPLAWLASLRSPWMLLLAIPPILFLAFFSPIGAYFEGLAAGRTRSGQYMPYVPLLSIQLILIDLGLLGLLFARLMFMQPDPRAAKAEVLPEPHIRVGPPPLIRHEPILTAMARIWHRRRGVLDPGAPWAVAILLTLLLVGFKLIHGASNEDLLRALLLPACIPGAIVSVVWRERLMNLQFESLYPASHNMFINELLGAAALSLVEMWISTLVAALAPIILWHHQLGTTMPIVVAVIIASALMQFLVFGVMLVASVYVRGMAILYANVLTIIAIVIPIEGAFGPVPSLSPNRLIVFALAEAAVGVLLTLYGTTAWRRADLA